MTNRSLVWIVLVSGCMQSHSGVESLGQTDCATCHVPRGDYSGTSAVALQDPAVPDHVANSTVYTTQCAECHVTATWYSHPEKLFAVQSGAHAGAQCTQCHANPDDNAGDAHGANTQCATCHPATEMVAGQTLVATHTTHPNAIWPQSHHASTCLDCHTSPTIATFDGYTNPPSGFTAQNFCLSCHPDGKNSTGSSDAPCTRCHRSPHHSNVPDPSGCLQQGCHYGGAGGD